jgi:hypothetical protein
MDETKAKKLVIFTAILVILLGWTHSMVPSKNNKNPGPPPVQFFIQIGILFFILSALADFKPRVAGWFAVLISTTSIFQNAPDFLTFITGLGTGPPANLKPVNQGVKAVNQALTPPPIPTLRPQPRTRTNPGWPPPASVGATTTTPTR